MAFDLFGSLRGLVDSADGLFDTIIDSTTQEGGPDIFTPLDEIRGLFRKVSGRRSFSEVSAKAGLTANTRSKAGLPDILKIKSGNNFQPGETQGVGSVDPRSFEREWADRMKQFLSIERETASKL